MPSTPQILTMLAAERLDEIRRFYQECAYGRPTEPHDEVVIAAEGDRVVGVVRLVEERGVPLLRGMYVATSHQRQGIGRRMLKRFEQLLAARHASEAYLTCGPHLEDFYGTIGFRKAGPSVIPPAFLVERKNGYVSRYGEQIIMYRFTGVRAH